MSEEITDFEAAEIIQLLDDCPKDLKDWDAKFVESNLTRKEFTPAQMKQVLRMEEEYL